MLTGPAACGGYFFGGAIKLKRDSSLTHPSTRKSGVSWGPRLFARDDDPDRILVFFAGGIDLKERSSAKAAEAPRARRFASVTSILPRGSNRSGFLGRRQIVGKLPSRLYIIEL